MVLSIGLAQAQQLVLRTWQAGAAGSGPRLPVAVLTQQAGWCGH